MKTLPTIQVKFRRSAVVLAAITASLAQAIATPELSINVQQIGSEPFASRTTSGPGPFLTDTLSGGGLSSQTATASFGSSHLTYIANVPASNPRKVAYGGPKGRWIDDTVIVTPVNSALNGTQATLRITYHATGTIGVNFGGNASGGWLYYDIAMDNGSSLTNPSVGYKSDCPGCYQPLSNFNTFLWDRTFTFGNPVNIDARHSVFANLAGTTTSGASGQADITLTQGHMEVVNAQGQPIDYTSSSLFGRGRGSNVAAGASYSGFALTNDTANGHVGTNLTLLGGSASANGSISANFTGPASAATTPLASDAVALNGTGTDPVVIQLDYPAGATLANFRLAWLNPTTGEWTNAVFGNTGGTAHFLNRAYNPATDFAIGNYGHDAASRKVWAVVNHNSVFAVADVPDPLAPTALVSRKSHAGTDFDLPLNLSDTPTVECRSGGATGDHTLIFTFNSTITGGNAAVTAGSGNVSGSPAISGNAMTINLTGVTNAQLLKVTLSNVTGPNGQTMPNTEFTVGFLLGDTNGDGTVNSGDATVVRSRSGQPTDATNFRNDVNTDGTVNSGDFTIVRGRSGTSL